MCICLTRSLSYKESNMNLTNSTNNLFSKALYELNVGSRISNTHLYEIETRENPVLPKRIKYHFKKFPENTTIQRKRILYPLSFICFLFVRMIYPKSIRIISRERISTHVRLRARTHARERAHTYVRFLHEPPGKQQTVINIHR